MTADLELRSMMLIFTVFVWFKKINLMKSLGTYFARWFIGRMCEIDPTFDVLDPSKKLNKTLVDILERQYAKIVCFLVSTQVHEVVHDNFHECIFFYFSALWHYE